MVVVEFPISREKLLVSSCILEDRYTLHLVFVSKGKVLSRQETLYTGRTFVVLDTPFVLELNWRSSKVICSFNAR